MSPAKTCLLILEAVEPELLRAGIAKGELPNLASLCASGWQGDINLLPGIGANALWPSLYTGLPPQHHGRFYHQQLEDGGYSARETHQTASLTPPFWAALAAQGRKVVIVDPPKAPPAQGPELCHISNWRSHFSYRGELAVHPAGLSGELTEAGLQSDQCPCLAQRFTSSTGYDARKLSKRLEEMIAGSRDLILNRIRHHDWDLFVAGLGAGHCAGHQLWHCHDPEYPGHISAAEGDLLGAVYQALDSAAGDIIANLPADTTLLVFVGPGMGPGHVHPALMGQLLDALDPATSRGPGKLRQHLTQLWRQLPAGWRRRLVRAGHWADQGLQRADFRHRPCFPVLTNDNVGGIRINLKGREEHGQIAPEDYSAYLDQLASQIAGLHNAETGEPLVTCLVKTRELYPGGELGAMPDLLVEWNEGAPVRAVTGPGLPGLEVTYPPKWSGAHNQHAMLILRETLSGRTTPGGTLPADSGVLDIAATISEACGGERRVGEGRSLLPWPVAEPSPELALQADG
ncbi:MAG: alkaline phosphatase family protein [Haliea sp.]|uniref:alkaline phosphatase family protein n=1 Tax=Haliea sp. TaxID=1932666 RepID=UPI0032ECBAF0